MRFGSRRGPSEFFFFSQIPFKIAWEDAVEGLGVAMSTEASEKKQGIVIYRQRVLQTVTFCVLFHLIVFRGHDLLKIANINPQQEARFSLWKK